MRSVNRHSTARQSATEASSSPRGGDASISLAATRSPASSSGVIPGGGSGLVTNTSTGMRAT